MVDIANGVTPEMIAATNAKFAYWDDVIANDKLNKGSPEEIKAIYKSLNDPTIYAYAFFKNPRNSALPLKLYPYQDLILNDTHKRIYFNAANQLGKSIGLCVKALHFAILNPGKTVLLTSKTLPQSKDLLRQIKNLLLTSSLDYKFDVGDSENKTELYLRHFEEVGNELRELPQSRIICVPATEAALGYAADLALVDELNFYEDGAYFYKQILQPRTYATKGQIMVFSNPNGQQGIGWELRNDPAFHYYKFNFFDCPTNTQEEFDALCSTLTREEIDSTLLAEFTSPQGGFFTLQERKDMQEPRMSCLPGVITSPLYIFYDWAKSIDRTVRVVGIPIINNEHDWAPTVYIHEILEYQSDTPYTKIVDEDLKALINLYGASNIAMIGWDNTGVGRGIEDFIKRVEQLGITTMPVEFVLENKSRIYTLFKLLAEQRRIKMPYVKECDKQLSTLVFNRTSRGYLQVHHINEKDRDDFPDAIAGFCSLIIAPDNPPVTMIKI